MDINTLVDNILLSHAAAEDTARARRSVTANRVADILPLLIVAAIIVPFLIVVPIIVVGITVAGI